MSLRQWSVTARRPVMRELRELGRPESHSRTGTFQIAKATLAAFVAWYIAAIVIGSGSGWLAPAPQPSDGDGDDEAPPPPFPQSMAAALSEGVVPLLEAVAAVVDTFGEDPVLHDGLSRQVTARLDHADNRYQDLARELATPVITDPEALEACGSMLWLLRRILIHLRDLPGRRDRV